MSVSLLRLRGLTKRFGGVVATDNVDLDIPFGEVHAVIGPNGAGKSTLVAQVFGELKQDAGRIELAGEPISHLPTPRRVRRGLARTFQIAQLLGRATVLDNVALAIQADSGHSFRFWRNARHDGRLREPALVLLADFGLAQRKDVQVAALSHGERKQLELVVALATRPCLLLLDEPMAGLGHVESVSMVECLRALKGKVAMLLIEHDMDAVFALADQVTVLSYGRIIATGSAAAVRRDRRVREAYLGESDE